MESSENECNHDAGVFRPAIDRNRCEGKADCIAVCPYDVFTIGTLPAQQRKNLSFMGKLKGRAHKWRQAFVTNSDACHGCGFCVVKCPEKAISLEKA
jgi:NAD-dependent dihydropyrimidine dehydrogenase PreA subunit